MKQSELRLLLTTARLLRAQLQEDFCTHLEQRRADLEHLNEALAPFDPSPVLDRIVNAAKQDD